MTCEDFSFNIGANALAGSDAISVPRQSILQSYNDLGIRTFAAIALVHVSDPGGELDIQIRGPQGELLWGYDYPADGLQANFSAKNLVGPLTLSWNATGTFQWHVWTHNLACDPTPLTPELFRVRGRLRGEPILVNCTSEPEWDWVLDWTYSDVRANARGRESFFVPEQAYQLEGTPYVAETLIGSWKATLRFPDQSVMLEFTTTNAHFLIFQAPADGQPGIFSFASTPKGIYSYDWEVTGPARGLGLPIFMASCDKMIGNAVDAA